MVEVSVSSSAGRGYEKGQKKGDLQISLTRVETICLSQKVCQSKWVASRSWPIRVFGFNSDLWVRSFEEVYPTG